MSTRRAAGSWIGADEGWAGAWQPGEPGGTPALSVPAVPAVCAPLGAEPRETGAPEKLLVAGDGAPPRAAWAAEGPRHREQRPGGDGWCPCPARAAPSPPQGACQPHSEPCLSLLALGRDVVPEVGRLRFVLAAFLNLAL